MSKTSADAPSALSDLKTQADLSFLLQHGLCRTISLELTPGDLNNAASLKALLKLLPSDTRLFISHLERDSLEKSLELASRTADAGLFAVPHIAARHYRDEDALRQAISSFRSQAGVCEILLLAGDRRRAMGSYQDSLDVLHSGVLENTGLKKLWFGAHPEGHAHASVQTLDKLMRQKTRYAHKAGFEFAFITQLCFEVRALLNWIKQRGKRKTNFVVHPSIFIKACRSKLVHLAKLIKTPSARLFLNGAIKPPGLADWRNLTDTIPQGRVIIGGLHFLSLGRLEDNVRLLATVLKRQQKS